MNYVAIILLMGACFVPGLLRQMFKPRQGSVPFVVYYPSRYRGICVGALISRTAVITAAVCVTNPFSLAPDTRPITVVTSTFYRHPRRGIRVQATRVLLPMIPNDTNTIQYLQQKSTAVLLLKRIVPDVLAEVPMRPVQIDYLGDTKLTTEQECLAVGWHFFENGDQVYPIHKFLLQRNLRAQFVVLSRKDTWCEALSIKFQKALSNLGFPSLVETHGSVCTRDGMYGSPLICEGKAVGMLMAPDAQWTNCTGFSNIYHLFSHKRFRDFMICISSHLFEATEPLDWKYFKSSLYQDIGEDYYDYIPNVYGKVVPHLGSSSSSSETEYEEEK